MAWYSLLPQGVEAIVRAASPRILFIELRAFMILAVQRIVRFGVMCPGTTLSAWSGRCLEKLVAAEGVELALALFDAAGVVNRVAWPGLVSFVVGPVLGSVLATAGQ